MPQIELAEREGFSYHSIILLILAFMYTIMNTQLGGCMNTLSKEVNLTKRIQISGAWRWCPVALTAKGHVKPDVVLIDKSIDGKGHEERHAEGGYWIEFRQNGKRIRQSVGKDAT